MILAFVVHLSHQGLIQSILMVFTSSQRYHSRATGTLYHLLDLCSFWKRPFLLMFFVLDLHCPVNNKYMTSQHSESVSINKNCGDYWIITFTLASTLVSSFSTLPASAVFCSTPQHMKETSAVSPRKWLNHCVNQSCLHMTRRHHQAWHFKRNVVLSINNSPEIESFV